MQLGLDSVETPIRVIITLQFVLNINLFLNMLSFIPNGDPDGGFTIHSIHFATRLLQIYVNTRSMVQNQNKQAKKKPHHLPQNTPANKHHAIFSPSKLSKDKESATVFMFPVFCIKTFELLKSLRETNTKECITGGVERKSMKSFKHFLWVKIWDVWHVPIKLKPKHFEMLLLKLCNINKMALP